MDANIADSVWVWLVLAVAAFVPRWGVVAWLRRRRTAQRRIRTDDALKHIHHALAEDRTPSLESVAGALHVPIDRASRMLADMERDRFVYHTVDGLALTPRGRARALHIIRAHRLWERHLADETGFDESDWHRKAERREHRITPEEADALSARLGHPVRDPHGDPIPTKGGRIHDHGGHPLTAMAGGDACRVVHVEDEPQDVYDRLVAGGFCPGLVIHVRDVSEVGYRVSVAGVEQTLSSLDAANLTVVPCEGGPDTSEAGIRLSSLRPGESGRVVGLSSQCRGAQRRRLMDLGVLPGAVIGVEMTSPGGDPVAYEVRDALIALRSRQADHIFVVPHTGSGP